MLYKHYITLFPHFHTFFVKEGNIPIFTLLPKQLLRGKIRLIGGDLTKKLMYLETGSTDAAYNLAFEEYVHTCKCDHDYLILWQNANAVIVGRNQNAEAEINRPFVDANNIQVIRRNTGGGTVYHDLGNLNYSFITDADGIDRSTLDHFLTPVVSALRNLGLDASASGRNDILVSGKKVSGTAQSLHKGRVLHHGTLLFDSNTEVLVQALNPDPTKFQSKGVNSVRSRVGNIRDHLQQDMSIAEFWAHIKDSLSSENLSHSSLSDPELQKVLEIKQNKYDTWQWNYGKSPKYQFQTKKRWPGGLLDIQLSAENSKISGIQICGDFLCWKPISELEQKMIGSPIERSALNAALDGITISDYLGSITREEFIDTLLNMT